MVIILSNSMVVQLYSISSDVPKDLSHFNNAGSRQLKHSWLNGMNYIFSKLGSGTSF